jgi:hypothetical protein
LSNGVTRRPYFDTKALRHVTANQGEDAWFEVLTDSFGDSAAVATSMHKSRCAHNRWGELKEALNRRMALTNCY